MYWLNTQSSHFPLTSCSGWEAQLLPSSCPDKRRKSEKSLSFHRFQIDQQMKSEHLESCRAIFQGETAFLMTIFEASVGHWLTSKVKHIQCNQTVVLARKWLHANVTEKVIRSVVSSQNSSKFPLDFHCPKTFQFPSIQASHLERDVTGKWGLCEQCQWEFSRNVVWTEKDDSSQEVG